MSANPKAFFFSGEVRVVDYTPTAAAVNPGDVIVINGIPYIAPASIAQNVLGALVFDGGVWKGNKVAGAWNVGDQIVWNPTGTPNVGTASSGAFQNFGGSGCVFAGYCVATPSTTAGALTGDEWGYFIKALAPSPSAAKFVLTAPILNTNVAGAAQNFGSFTVPANTLEAGSRIRVRGQLIGTTRTASDTCALALNLGVGGTLLFTLAGAFAHATTNFLYFDTELVIQTSGSSGTLQGAGIVNGGTAGATTTGLNLASTAINTTVANVIELQGTFSASNTTDQITVNIFDIDVV